MLRESFKFALACIAAMLAAIAWRASPLPAAWHLPFHTFGSGAETGALLMLLIPPGCVAFVVLCLGLEELRRSNGTTAINAWRIWNDNLIFAYCIVVTALQAVMLGGTLGLGANVRFNAGRAVVIVIAGLLIWVGNNMPKLPPLVAKWGFEKGLAPENTARLLRLRGQLLVAFGCAVIVSALALPQSCTTAVVYAGTAAMSAISALRAVQLKRRQGRVVEEG